MTYTQAVGLTLLIITGIWVYVLILSWLTLTVLDNVIVFVAGIILPILITGLILIQ